MDGHDIVDLDTLTPSQGFEITGPDGEDKTGVSVSAAGDVNGDGFDDLIVGSPYAHDGAGAAYVVYGAPTSVTSSTTVTVNVNPVLETPDLEVGSTSVSLNEGSSISLNITVTPFDSDDTVSITISGVPSDATLSAGTHNSDGTWTLTPEQLSGLTLFANEEGTATLHVVATNTEFDDATYTGGTLATFEDVSPDQFTGTNINGYLGFHWTTATPAFGDPSNPDVILFDANTGEWSGVTADSQPPGHWVANTNYFGVGEMDISKPEGTFSLDSGWFASLVQSPIAVTFTGFDADHNSLGSETFTVGSPTFLTFGPELQNVSDVEITWDNSGDAGEDNLVFDNLLFDGNAGSGGGHLDEPEHQRHDQPGFGAGRPVDAEPGDGERGRHDVARHRGDAA